MGSGFSSPRVVPSAAVPAATTAAAVAFFATRLSFDPALGIDGVLDFDDRAVDLALADFVLAFGAFLTFDLSGARFVDLPRFAAFFMRSSGDVCLGGRQLLLPA